MDSIARFRCPHCLQITTFCPQVHEAVFGPASFASFYLSYEVACRYCRRAFLFTVRRPPALIPTEAEVPRM